MSNTKEIGLRMVRLTSGEEIVCKVVDNDTTYTLKKPHILIPMKEGQLAIVPWCPYADIGTDGIELKKDHVMFVVKIDTGLADQYNQMTTGLVTAPVGMDTSKLKLNTRKENDANIQRSTRKNKYI